MQKTGAILDIYGRSAAGNGLGRPYRVAATLWQPSMPAMTRKLYARAEPLANSSVSSVGRTFGAAAKQLLHSNGYSV